MNLTPLSIDEGNETKQDSNLKTRKETMMEENCIFITGDQRRTISMDFGWRTITFYDPTFI